MTPHVWHRWAPIIARNDRILVRWGMGFLAGAAIMLVGGYLFGWFPGPLGGVAFSLVAALFVLLALGFAAHGFKNPPPLPSKHPVKTVALWYMAFVVDLFLVACSVFIAVGIVGMIAGR